MAKAVSRFDEEGQVSRTDFESAVESLRWRWERLGFKTPEEFKARRGEDWFAKGRNHREWSDPGGGHFRSGIERELRDDGEDLGVGDNDVDTLQVLCLGRSIVKIERDPTEGGWVIGENTVTITLDDGATLTFYGWGHDASGVDTTYSPPGEPGDV